MNSISQQIWKTQPWPQDWKRWVFIPISKKDNAKWMHNCTHLTRSQSNAQKFPSKSSPVHEPWNSRCQVGFRKGRGTRDQITNMHWIIEKAREFQKSICFCSIDYALTNMFLSLFNMKIIVAKSVLQRYSRIKWINVANWII